ncbi:hypothetical protein [Streptomyces violens]|nr:hypothetical protein [Streptomyces violens]
MFPHLVLPLGIALGSALLAPGLLARARWASSCRSPGPTTRWP